MRKTSATQLTGKWLGLAIALPALLTGAAYGQYAQKNVVQPGDAIIASSANSPPTESVGNAIDGGPAKYLNFDMKNDALTAGFIVTPSVGPTWVTGIAIETANDGPERDPADMTLEGSNDTITNYTDGTWTLIAEVQVPAVTNRFLTRSFSFTNYAAFKSYRWTVIKTAQTNTCCMQVGEVQLLGTALPKNVVQPTDQIFASSANSPPTESVGNAIDGGPAKYLNFDMKNDALTAGFAVTPSVGATVINGLTIETANDGPERDPASVTVEGSNDDTITNYSGGSWTLIAAIPNIPAITNRFFSRTFLFPNFTPYKHYRWTTLLTAQTNTCCMQVAEVQFLGSGAPKNVIVPTDAIIASSANSPPTESVGNAIDGGPAKYLNFDMKNDALTAGFVVTPAVGATTIIGLGMETANDGPERDPEHVTVEGSNDDTVTNFSGGTWSLIADINNIQNVTNRFFFSYYYFPNQTSYKHYRWTVIKTAQTNTCCMQVAEVQLLAITSQADCSKAAFVSQPSDAPVLRGTKAQFFTSVNGPWPLQWTVNGVAAPGANQAIFTTDFIDASNAANVYAVQIVGCQTSAPVHAVIFTPSTTESIGVQFAGGGANGAPTYLQTNDIVGVQQQAFWNIATNGSGSTGDQTTLPDVLNDSSNNATTVTFSFQSSGAWGAGTGVDQPTQRLLNGLVGANGGTPLVDQVFTFGNVPAGKHALLVYSVSPPTQKQRVSYSITNAPAQTVYMRTLAADEYNPAPGFYRSTSTSATSPEVGDFVRFDGVSPDASSNITLIVDVLDNSGVRPTGVNAIQLLLNAPNPGSPPTITKDLQPTVGPAGGSVTLSVTATGTGLTYQWRKNGVAIQNGGDISGANTSTLTINPLNPADVGVYSVAIFSSAGSTVSANASVRISTYNIQDSLVGYWKLDESGTATNAVNSATNGTHDVAEIFTSTPTWVAGKVGNAYSFDANTWMFVTNFPKASSGVAASAWVNLNGTPPGGSMALIQNAEPNLYVQGGNGTHVIGSFEFTLAFDSASGNMFPEAGVGVGASIYTVTGTTPVPVTGWHNVAFTADGAQVVVYVDGQPAGSVPYSGTIASPDIPWLSIGARLNADTNTLVGVSPDANPEFMFGSLDEVALWDRALSSDEVTALFAAGNGGKSLTTIVETPPVTTSGTLKASIAAGKITVTWTTGSLQTAPSPTGPWTNVTTTGNTVTEAVGAGAKFYRTH